MREWTPSRLIQASGMYWESCAIHAAVHLDVFSVLKNGPLAATELAARLDGDVRGTEMLITALCALGLLSREGGRCMLTPFSREYLCRDSASYIGHMIEHQRDLVPGWAQLDKAVREGRPVRLCSSSTGDGEERESFLMGMYNIANAQAALSVPRIDLSGCENLLDLGGGTGAYAVHFCRCNPGLRATVFDLPTSRPFAEKVIAGAGLDERIRFVGGDFTTDELPDGFDVAWLSQILHGMGPDEAAAVVARAGKALKPHGLLLIQEFVLDDDRCGPEHPALFSLNMLVGTPHGQSYTGAEITAFMIAAGASDIRCLPLQLPMGCAILAGTISA